MLQRAASLRLSSHSLVACQSVVVAADRHGGRGAFAAHNMKSGAVVERGCVHVLAGVDGNAHESLFRWGPLDWAAASGCGAFYKCALDGRPNVAIRRDLERGQYVMEALSDIRKDEELFRVFERPPWRACFAPWCQLQERAGRGDGGAWTPYVETPGWQTPPRASF